jgi:signal transduction histidine kinase
MQGPQKSLEEQLAEALRENALLKASIADSDAFFEMAPVPLAISIDADAREIRVNSAFAKLLGIAVGTNASVLSNDKLPYRFLRSGVEVPGEDLPLPKCCRTGQEVADELEIARADGQRFHIYGCAKPLLDEEGKVRRALSAFVDVTAKKEAEVALEKTLKLARLANEELQQFTYAASHDLQEPLRSISSYAQLLQRQFAENKEAQEFTSFIVDGVNRMNALIRDLLTYSRMGTSPKRTAIGLSALLQWSLLNLERSVRETGAQVTYGDLPQVSADETQIVQLFQNLLSNSFKYRSADPPKIEISADEGIDFYTISVKDNGIGIDPRFHQQVFGVFKRLHGREVPGTGIGLALCRKIVEGHGGKIWVESDGKHGSVFKFTLPL